MLQEIQYGAGPFRMYPTEAQEIFLSKNVGCCRFIYNWALGQIKDAWEKDKKRLSISKDISPRIPKLKEELEWLKEVNSVSLIQSLRHLDAAFQNFFRRVKNGQTPGYPKFKSKYKGKQSFAFHQGYKLYPEKNRIDLPKCKNVKVTFHRPIEGIPKTVTITRLPTGKWQMTIQVVTNREIPDAPLPLDDSGTVGIDMGVRTFATLNRGVEGTSERIEQQNLSVKLAKQLARSQRKLSRKMKGSSGFKKQKIKINRIHEKIKNQRNDTLHKKTTDLVRRDDMHTFAMEDLDIKGMTARNGAKNNLDIHDASWYAFKHKLKYKSQWNGKNLIEADRFDPTSQLCYCGYKHTALGSEEVWECPSCHRKNDRDCLGAYNVRKFALKKQCSLKDLGDKPEVGSVRPELTP